LRSTESTKVHKIHIIYGGLDKNASDVISMIDGYFEIRDIMALFRIKSRNTVYNLIEGGELKAKRLHRRKQVIAKEEVRRFIKRHGIDIVVQ